MKTIEGMQKKGEANWNWMEHESKNCIKKNSTYKNKRIQPINVEPNYKKLKEKKLQATKKIYARMQ